MYLIWDKWAVRVCTGFSSYIGEYKYMVRKDRFILCLVLNSDVTDGITQVPT